MASLTATTRRRPAAVETARLNLQSTEIAAPISGRTGALGVHVGDLVRANDTTPIVVINQLSPIYVAFSVPGRYPRGIRRYQAQRPLTVTAMVPTGVGTSDRAPAGAGTSPIPPPGSSTSSRGSRYRRRPRKQAPSFIDNTVDSGDGHDRLKATFPNDDRTAVAGRLRAGDAEPDDGTRRTAWCRPPPCRRRRTGQYVYVVKYGPHGRAAPGHGRSGSRATSSSIAAARPPAKIVVTDGQLRLTPAPRLGASGGAGVRGGPREPGRAARRQASS